MAEANGGGGEGAVQPDAARQYLATFAHSPDAIKTMPDADVVAYHGRVRGAVDTAVQEAVKQRGDWTPEWRQRFAGDDPEAMKSLERMQSPADVWKSYKELRTKFSAGEAKFITPYPAQGTPEQQAQWRGEQGVPVKPEEYHAKLPAGIVIGEADKPFIDNYLKYAHEQNLPQAAVNTSIKWWHEDRVARQEAAAEELATAKQKTEDTLRQEWGEDYRPNQNRIAAMLDANLPSTEGDLKTKMINTMQASPEFARFMAGVAFKINPTPTAVMGGAEGQATAINEWLAKADALMRTDRKAYDKTMAKDYTSYATAYKNHTGKEWGRK